METKSNIKKIIVDELPVGCRECELASNTWKNNKFRKKCDIKHWIIKDMYARPSWCPLVTYDECFDWMFFRQPATSHIEDILNGKYVPEDLRRSER